MDVLLLGTTLPSVFACTYGDHGVVKPNVSGLLDTDLLSTLRIVTTPQVALTSQPV